MRGGGLVQHERSAKFGTQHGHILKWQSSISTSLFEGRLTRTRGLSHYPALGRSPVFDGVGSKDSVLENGESRFPRMSSQDQRPQSKSGVWEVPWLV